MITHFIILLFILIILFALICNNNLNKNDIAKFGGSVNILTHKNHKNHKNITHVISNKYSDKFTNELNNDSKKMEYQSSSDKNLNSLHWGQLKLMLSEMDFLNYVIKDMKDKKDKRKIILVYPGSAPGCHINYLSELYSNVYFELYDPRKFNITNYKKINTYTQLFTDTDAKNWKNKKECILLVSDIRVNPPTEDQVKKDMDLQLQWWKIMNPDYAMFKFRLPWNAGKTKYPEGIIRLQAYAPQTSTETRLIVKKDAPIIDYDNKDYDDKCYYHNKINRNTKYKNILGNNLNLYKDKIDNCYDCTLFVSIVKSYLEIQNKPVSKQSVKDLIDTIVKKISFDQFDLYSRTIYYLSKPKPNNLND